MRIDRKEFLEEMMLRKYISTKLRAVLNEQGQKSYDEEVQLRNIIRKILKEEDGITGYQKYLNQKRKHHKGL